MNQKFCNILVGYACFLCIYHVTKAVEAVVGIIVLVGVQTHCALVYSLGDFKSTQINMQCCLICELMLYKFKWVHNTMEATKNICCLKGTGTVIHSTITGKFKKLLSGCKNLNQQGQV